MWLSNLDMTKKLLVSPLAAVLFLVVFGIVACGGLIKQKRALDDIYNYRSRAIKLLRILWWISRKSMRMPKI
jgi:hypothetical protein